jgi:hypothetical protein
MKVVEPRIDQFHEFAVLVIGLVELLEACKNRFSEAEPLSRRHLEIFLQFNAAEFAVLLIGLVELLEACKNRFSEAEPLSRRHLEIFLQFNAATGHEHPHLHAAIANYADLLGEMGHSPVQIDAQLEGIGRPFGMRIG